MMKVAKSPNTRSVNGNGKPRAAASSVRGLCGSACTLYLKSRYLCAEPSAQFVFHASYFRYGKLGTAGDDPEANSYMLQWYPARIKEFIASQGGLTATPIYLEGRWMQQLVPACS